jgi:hypothetical protein
MVSVEALIGSVEKVKTFEKKVSKGMKITLCGSGRFWDDFDVYESELSRAGHIVYILGDRLVNYTNHTSVPEDEHLEHKETLDLVHLAKIMNSDCVVVVRGNEYIGESTRREIKWARILGKSVYMNLDNFCRHIASATF